MSRLASISNSWWPRGLIPRTPPLPHGADAEVFTRATRSAVVAEVRSERWSEVLYVGRIAKEKDLDVLIEVYQQLATRRPEVPSSWSEKAPFYSR